ncbi:hypothetical protein DP130_03170 [Clostridium tetani]|uniref:Uncharacterized protein n=1 Tax=Clostridium tetani TaxID=1513 RepID=A0A4Q0VE64_CLOTA|nr:hypothetical protein [Clostridium tetani]RXI49993.1 hypothetical protein DP130_03170 [Clostridium tetani]BDR67713.1 hypothetical protein K144312032_19410 [Clostridium tetani]
MIDRIKKFKPQNVCIIHSEVMKQFKKATGIELRIGYNGRVFKYIDTEFYFNYFPNHNNISTETKVKIYEVLRNNI